MLIRRTEEFNELCQALRAGGWFVFDTEFVGEKTYYPRLGLLQIATDDRAAVVDPEEVNLVPFQELLANPDVLKVVHAGRSDFEIFHQRSGQPPQNVFDTQMAAAMLGYGESISYASLVHQITGVRLSKLETFTDWTQRPLTPEQIEYALDDVRHLTKVYHALVRKLRRSGRTEWVREEFRRLESPALYEKPEPRDQYKHLKRSGHLTPRNLAVLRELAAWREGAARTRNVPRGQVMRDEVLVEIGRRAITRVAPLRDLRGIHPREVERSGNDIVAAVKTGLAVPDRECPELPKRQEHPAGTATITSLLDAYVKVRAHEVGIAAPLLATKDELFRVVDHANGRLDGDAAVLRGWRRKVIGDDLLALLSGQAGLALDPRTGRVRLTRQVGPSALEEAPKDALPWDAEPGRDAVPAGPAAVSASAKPDAAAVEPGTDPLADAPEPTED
ncbi:MAG: ribonuclease D [Planctomycetes bacterium]|nr:ribonuclease D [Planctomycetota bacterium]